MFLYTVSNYYNYSDIVSLFVSEVEPEAGPCNRPTKLCARSSAATVITAPDEEDSRDEAPHDEVQTSTVMEFKPLHIQGQWKEPGTTTDICSISIILPAGVGKGAFLLKVTENGTVLELKVDWPRCLSDVHVMYRKWLDETGDDGFTEYHPRVVAMDNALKALRSHARQKIKSVTKFSLPFPVRKDIHGQTNLAFEDARMVYVELKAITSDYAETHDNQEFEVM